jgi:hypothetical protein
MCTQVGGKGVWIILEEALLELSQYQSSCQLADVVGVHLICKSEAYDLFGEVAKVGLPENVISKSEAYDLFAEVAQRWASHQEW